nr:L-threonylcarbamoyladenylate synthase [Treponema sp.]
MYCLKSSEDSKNLVVSCLREGKIVILPTDTVYGFSGIVNNSYKTDDAIRTIKGRSESKPLIQLLSSAEKLSLYTDDKIPTEILSKWPGALTVIVNVKKELIEKMSMPTIAFRVPGDKWLRDIIECCNAPIYSTSVNKSGMPVLDEIENIKKVFGNDVDLIVDDGDKKGALPSTLVKIDSDGSVKVL